MINETTVIHNGVNFRINVTDACHAFIECVDDSITLNRAEYTTAHGHVFLFPDGTWNIRKPTENRDWVMELYLSRRGKDSTDAAKKKFAAILCDVANQHITADMRLVAEREDREDAVSKARSDLAEAEQALQTARSDLAVAEAELENLTLETLPSQYTEPSAH